MVSIHRKSDYEVVVCGDAVPHNPVVRLEEVHRFGDNAALLDLSVMARNGESIPFKRFDEKVAKVRETDPSVNEFILNNLKDFSDGVCLCGTNNTRVDVNQLIRLNYGIIEDIEDKVPRINDRVVCLKNYKNYVEPVYNGVGLPQPIVRRADEVGVVLSVGVPKVPHLQVQCLHEHNEH